MDGYTILVKDIGRRFLITKVLTNKPLVSPSDKRLSIIRLKDSKKTQQDSKL